MRQVCGGSSAKWGASTIICIYHNGSFPRIFKSFECGWTSLLAELQCETINDRAYGLCHQCTSAAGTILAAHDAPTVRDFLRGIAVIMRPSRNDIEATADDGRVATSTATATCMASSSSSSASTRSQKLRSGRPRDHLGHRTGFEMVVVVCHECATVTTTPSQMRLGSSSSIEKCTATACVWGLVYVWIRQHKWCCILLIRRTASIDNSCCFVLSGADNLRCQYKHTHAN